MKFKHDFRTCSKQNFEEYKKLHPKSTITFQEYKKVIYTYTKIIVEYLIETGEKLKLPYGLGEFFINKTKSKKKFTRNGKEYIYQPIDWKKTKEEGTWVFHKNYHTDGYKFKFGWFPDSAKFKTPKIWGFHIMRDHSRNLAKILKVPNNKHQHLYKEWF